jgi:hypothetical protein
MKRIGLGLFGAAVVVGALGAAPGCASSGGGEGGGGASDGGPVDGDAGDAGEGARGDSGVVDVKVGRFPGFLTGTDWHPDPDGDGVPSATDKCPHRYDPAQADADGDGVGDACDPDASAIVAGGPIVDLTAEHVTPFSAWITFTSTIDDVYGTDTAFAWSTTRGDFASLASFNAIPAARKFVKRVRAKPGAPVEFAILVEGLPPSSTVYLAARPLVGAVAVGNVLEVRTPAAPVVAPAADRPTVFVRKAGLDAWAQRARGGDAAIAAWRARIEAQLARITSPDETDAQHCANASLLYHATGDASRLAQAKSLHARAQRYWASTALTGNQYRWANAMLGVCTDLLWGELTPAERTAAVTAMLADDEAIAFRTPPLLEDTDESDGATRTLVIDGLVGCRAPGLDAALSDRACKVLEQGLRRAYGQMLVMARRDRGMYALSGGHLADGSDYGPKTGRYWGQLLRALQVNGAPSGDYAGFASNYVRSNYVHGLTPAKRGFVSWGDVSSTTNNAAVEPFSWAIEPPRQDGLYWMVGVLEGAGDAGGAARARRALEVFTPYANELSHPNLLFAAATPSGTNDLENAWLDSGMGILYDRTGWSANDSMLVAKATWGGVDHQQEDAGEWRLWRKGQWVVHPSVSYGGNAGRVAGHGTLNLTVIAEGDAAREGQYVIHPGSPPRLERAWSDGVVSLAEMDLTGAYRSYYYYPQYYSGVRRTVVWWKSAANDEVVVFDRVDDLPGAPAQKRWQLHFPKAPSVSGTGATVALGGTTNARVDALLPSGVSLATRAPVSTPEDSQEDVYTHRLVGSASAANPRFLTVTQAGDGTLTAARVGTGASCALVGTRATVFVEAGEGTCTLPAAPLDVLLAGLAPKSRVKVTLDGAVLRWTSDPSISSSIEVSEAGHVRLQVKEGGLAEVTRAAVAP